MPKKVRLTYKNERQTITEDVLLMEENDQIFTEVSDNPVMIVNDEGVGNTVAIFMGDKVIFEDEEGIFGLDPTDVINIEPLED